MKEPTRVLQVVGSLDIGGIQSYLMELYRHIDKSKVQFDFIVHIKTKNSYANEIESMGGKVFYIEDDCFEKKAWIKYIKYWKNFVNTHHEYKIIHGHLRSMSAIYLHIAKKAGYYTIAHSHATSNGCGMSAKIKDILQYPTRYIADYCLGCSYQANMWMFGKKRAESGNCNVIKNGICTERYVYNEQIRNETRERLKIRDNSFVVGLVGRLVELKNQELLVDVVFKIIKNRDVSLIIVGDGPLHDKLKGKIEKRHLDDYIQLLGSRSDVNKLYQAFDCFAMPSISEGLGIAVIEAQAADLPVLISPAIADEACITENIIRINDYDVDTWSNMILQIERKQRYDRSNIIKEAGYDIQSIANELCELYYRCLQVGEE